MTDTLTKMNKNLTAKTTRYRMLDGKIFEAAHPSALLDAMRRASFHPDESLADYIKRTARASHKWNGKSYRDDSAENLLEDLIAGGLITVLD